MVNSCEGNRIYADEIIMSLPKGIVAKYVDMKALPISGYSINEVVEKEYAGGAKFKAGDVLLARITPCLENEKTGLC